MLDVVQIPSNEIAAIEWNGDHIDYDTQLHELGSDYDEFIVINPWLEDKSLIHYIEYLKLIMILFISNINQSLKEFLECILN
jgi:hypothetical protein